MVLKGIKQMFHSHNVKRRVTQKAAALPLDQQSMAAIYALGIRDGLQIAADIRQKTRKSKGDA